MNPLVRALIGAALAYLAGALAAIVVNAWRRARWRKHEPPGFLIGWLHADGQPVPGHNFFFILHLGPGYLEWGSLADSIRKPEPPVTYRRPRWMR